MYTHAHIYELTHSHTHLTHILDMCMTCTRYLLEHQLCNIIAQRIEALADPQPASATSMCNADPGRSCEGFRRNIDIVGGAEGKRD